MTVYGQQEVVKDLIKARLETGAGIHFEAEGMRISDLETSPKITFREHGEEHTLHCDFIADLWSARIEAVRDHGLEHISDAIMQRWFGAEFRHEQAALVRGYQDMLERQPTV